MAISPDFVVPKGRYLVAVCTIPVRVVATTMGINPVESDVGDDVYLYELAEPLEGFEGKEWVKVLDIHVINIKGIGSVVRLTIGPSDCTD